LYDQIFTPNLNGTQVVIAVLIFRIAENKRKRPPEGVKPFIPYASCFIAMQMGKWLLRDLGADLPNLNHQNFLRAKDRIESNGELYFEKASREIEQALELLYGGAEISIQQLSATFRRGDLIEKLEMIDRE
jgi:hypothetical protein